MTNKSLVAKRIEPVISEPENNKFSITPYEDDGFFVSIGQCKLCQSQYRAEAEKKFLQTNISAVYRFLNDEKKEGMSYSAVRNHLTYHFKRPMDASLEREFAEDLKGWMSIQHNTQYSLIKNIAILDKEITALAAGLDGLSLDRRCKINETINKLSNTLLLHRTKLEEIKKDKEPIIKILEMIKDIMTEEIQREKNDILRNFAVLILDRLQQQCADILIEET